MSLPIAEYPRSLEVVSRPNTLKAWCVTLATTFCTVVLVELIFGIMSLSFWPGRNVRTEFAFQPVVVQSWPIIFALILAAALTSKRTHPLAAFGIVGLVYFVIGQAPLAWSGPGEQLSFVMPLILVKELLVILTFALPGLLLSLPTLRRQLRETVR